MERFCYLCVKVHTHTVVDVCFSIFINLPSKVLEVRSELKRSRFDYLKRKVTVELLQLTAPKNWDQFSHQHFSIPVQLD